MAPHPQGMLCPTRDLSNGIRFAAKCISVISGMLYVCQQQCSFRGYHVWALEELFRRDELLRWDDSNSPWGWWGGGSVTCIVTENLALTGHACFPFCMFALCVCQVCGGVLVCLCVCLQHILQWWSWLMEGLTNIGAGILL